MASIGITTTIGVLAVLTGAIIDFWIGNQHTDSSTRSALLAAGVLAFPIGLLLTLITPLAPLGMLCLIVNLIINIYVSVREPSKTNHDALVTAGILAMIGSVMTMLSLYSGLLSKLAPNVHISKGSIALIIIGMLFMLGAAIANFWAAATHTDTTIRDELYAYGILSMIGFALLIGGVVMTRIYPSVAYIFVGLGVLASITVLVMDVYLAHGEPDRDVATILSYAGLINLFGLILASMALWSASATIAPVVSQFGTHVSLFSPQQGGIEFPEPIGPLPRPIGPRPVAVASPGAEAIAGEFVAL